MEEPTYNLPSRIILGTVLIPLGIIIAITLKPMELIWQIVTQK